MSEPELVLVFDGTCGVCSRLARWIRRRDGAGRVLAVANQEDGVLERYGLTREEADRSAWAIDRFGRRREGAAAINEVMAAAGGYPAWLAAPYRVAPLAAIEDAAYRWFAPRRSRFARLGGRPECDEPGSKCR